MKRHDLERHLRTLSPLDLAYGGLADGYQGFDGGGSLRHVHGAAIR
jgi:hypothetical protein